MDHLTGRTGTCGSQAESTRLIRQTTGPFLGHGPNDEPWWCPWKSSQKSASIRPRTMTGCSELSVFSFNRYDAESVFFEENVRSSKRQQFISKALQLVHPAFISQLGHLRVKSLQTFKTQVEQLLRRGEAFAASVRTCSESCITAFDKGCSDAAIRHANWDASKVRDKLRRDIESHVSSVRNDKLSELMATYEKQITAALAEPVESLFEVGGSETWASIRKLLKHETDVAISCFSPALSGFELDQDAFDRKMQNLKDYARSVVEKKAREEAGKVLMRMKDRFNTVFSHDSDSIPRLWTGKEDIKSITLEARSESLKLLSIVAAIRLDEKSDRIESILFSRLLEGKISISSRNSDIADSCDPLASSSWEEVSPENTLLTPVQCLSLWRQFIAETEYTVSQAISAQEAYRQSNNWLPPAWAIVTMIILGFNEFMLLLRNPLYLFILFVVYLFGKALWIQMDIPGEFRNGTVSTIIVPYYHLWFHRFLEHKMGCLNQLFPYLSICCLCFPP
ncbi:protein ROOT HAIR DEFECTIVE 3 homolog 2-like [Solanum stenotomum]|uniref:protein ROOT HAIR DEFECTIVE 3 homolog 2-like n=1 Tax=Solanum stenotomum TaxID=172797 RepID=UPI0020D1B020|nr:protein ROOT HAIR DEFECTIVE 3 homolog 2-like [Solanum stenotomum]